MKRTIILIVVVLSHLSFGLDLSQWTPRAWNGADAEAKARAAVSTQLKNLRAWLKKSALEDKCHLLQCDALEAKLSGAPIAELKTHLNLFRKLDENLEEYAYINVQQALRHWIRILEVQAEGNYAEAFAKRKSQIAALGSKPQLTQMEQSELGAHIGWMKFTGQSHPEVEKLAQKYRYPNAQMRVSKKLLDFAFEGRKVKETQTVSQGYEGGVSTGTFTTQGNVKLTLVPNNQYPVIGVEFVGQTFSPSVYWRRNRIELWSSVTTNIRAVEQIQFTLDGLKTYRPQVWTSSDVRPYASRARFRFMERIAFNQAWNKVGSAEANASQQAAQRAGESLQKQVQEQITKASQEFQGRFRKNIIFVGAFPKAISGKTTTESLEIGVTEQNGFELAASTAPTIPAQKHDLTIQFHESSIRNFMQNFLGGKVERDDRFYNAYKVITGEEPYELRPHDRAPRWHVVNEERAPVVPQFENGWIRFTIRGSRACIKQVEATSFECIDGDISATALYKPTIRNKGIYLVRDGETKVEIKPKGEAPQLEAFQAFFHRKFNAFLSEEWNFEGLALPKGSTWEKFNKLQPVEFTAYSHWMTVGFALAQ